MSIPRSNMDGPEVSNSARRTLALLVALGQRRGGASLATLAADVGLPPPTAHRLLKTLVAGAFAIQDSASRQYMIGPAAMRLALSLGPGGGIQIWARPTLESLMETTGETVYLSARFGFELVYLECLEPDATIHMSGTPGTSGPLHATSQGKVLIAFMKAEERDRMVSSLPLPALTPRTIVDRRVLAAELARVREVGYAIADEEREVGVRSIAAPVLDADGIAVAAVCAGAPAFRCSVERLRTELASPVMTAARSLSAQLVNSPSRSMVAVR